MLLTGLLLVAAGTGAMAVRRTRLVRRGRSEVHAAAAVPRGALLALRRLRSVLRLLTRVRDEPRRERLADLLELRARGHLLGIDRGLDAVEQPLQPTDQLCLRDAQLALARRALGERQQIGRAHV